MLSGAIELGAGSIFDPATMRTLTSGSFIRLPADAPRFMTTKLGATVQVFGNGPFEINPL